MRSFVFGGGAAVGLAGLIMASCTAAPAPHEGQGGAALGANDSVGAKRLAELRGRFVPLARPTSRASARDARVVLPALASGETRVVDERSRVAIAFVLEGATGERAHTEKDVTLYRGAVEGGDLVDVVGADGVEDYVVFERAPAREELRYAVDISSAAGLRLVSNTLEILDATATPVLRISPPYVVSERGERREATLSVDGCAYDTSPAAPWGRPITSPGASRCTVRVAWSGTTYPAIVDPAWITTGSLVRARVLHAATLLKNGRVLVVGGDGQGSLDQVTRFTTELYEEATGVFVASGTLLQDPHVSVQPRAQLLPSGRVAVSFTDFLEQYDPVTGMFVNHVAIPQPLSGGYTTTALSNGKILAVGHTSNYEPNPYTTVALVYDPNVNGGAGGFGAPIFLVGPGERLYHTATLLASGKVLVAGGYGALTKFGELQWYRNAEIFDPAANGGLGAFSETGLLMSTGRHFHTATLLPSGKVVLVGGQAADDSSWDYDERTEIFDPAGNGGIGTFTIGGSLPYGRDQHVAALTAGGQILIAGGRTRSSPTSSFTDVSQALLFNPIGLGEFLTIPSLSGRRKATATPLPSGRILIAGGISGILPSTVLAAAVVLATSNGEVCTKPAQCTSGFCVDGVCCATACTGTCEACAITTKKDASPSGTCGPARAEKSCGSVCVDNLQYAKTCGENGACVASGDAGPACNVDAGAGDGGEPSEGGTLDAGEADAGEGDAGTPPSDAGVVDAWCPEASPTPPPTSACAVAVTPKVPAGKWLGTALAGIVVLLSRRRAGRSVAREPG